MGARQCGALPVAGLILKRPASRRILMTATPNNLATPRPAMLAGIGLMLLGVFLFSCNDALGKWLLGTYSVGQMLFIRSIAAMLALIPFLWRSGLAPFAAAS